MSNDLAPRHLQLRELLLRRWKTNGMKVGDRIESQNEIIKFCDYSLITVVKTLKDLEAEGIIRRQVGKGSFLMRAPWAETYHRIGLFYNRDVVGGGIFNNNFYSKLVAAFETRVVTDGHAFLLGSFTHKQMPVVVWDALDAVVLTSITAETDLSFIDRTTSQISVIDQTLNDPRVHCYRIDYAPAFEGMFAQLADRSLKYLYLDSEISSSEQIARRAWMEEAFARGRSDNQLKVIRVDQESDADKNAAEIVAALESYQPDVICGYLNPGWNWMAEKAPAGARIYPFTLEPGVAGFFVDPAEWMEALLPQIYANLGNRQQDATVHSFPARFAP